ncbi:hypothetical protein BSPLISOX_813 [uncultured Gammaproteobacteria bacterium]|jgi:predicted ABC-type ATPase|nr:hypothetical protein [uncultured Gammaproteobacteria bacterium]VVH67248.1 hypothetical protein BSPLISOX_813 [uncultured Gammaproteobacteria bacterium]
MRKNKPVLIVVAGPNGSGKTTITERLLTHSWTDNATYINPDIIAQEQFGGWNNKEAVLKAANHAEEMRHNCIKNQQNFIFKEERIKIRTLKGGHTVPAEKIKSRYSKSIDNCSKVINLVDRAYIYDNSENSELLFRTVKNNGKHGMRFYKGHNSWAWGIHNTAFDNILNQVAG